MQRIKENGDIFWAQSDSAWVLDGATVHVSMVAFDDGSQTERILDGNPVASINANLSTDADTTLAATLPENVGIAFIGTQKGGSFDILDSKGKEMLAAVGNPNGRPNSDVVVPWINASDVTGHCRDMWVIDFGPTMSEKEAAKYEAPFEYAKKHVLPQRQNLVEPITDCTGGDMQRADRVCERHSRS